MPPRLQTYCTFLLLLSFFYSAPALAAKKVGVVKEAKGKTTVVHENEKKSLPLKVQDSLFLKDVVETGKKSFLQVAFQDKTSLTLQENSRILVMPFLYEIPKGKIKALVFKSKTQFKTPTAVVGVRGTEIILEVSKKKTKVFCLKGALNVFNPRFPQKIVTMAAGKFTDVLLGQLPSLPIAIPPEILDQLESEFNIPLSIESLKERGLEKLRQKIPGF